MKPDDDIRPSTRTASAELALLRTIFDKAAVGVAQIETASGRFLLVNQRYADIVGYTREELDRLDARAITWSEDLAANLESMRRLVEGNIGDFSEELRYRRKDGSSVWVEQTVSPLWAPGEPPYSHVAVVEDITARKGMAAEVVHLNRQLRRLSEAAQQVNALLEIPAILRGLVAAALELTGAEGGSAGLLEEGKLVFTEYHLGGQLVPVDYQFEVGHGVPGWVAQTRTPYVSADAEHDPHVIPEIQRALGFHTLVDVPLLSRAGMLLGCFEIHNKVAGGPFTTQDVELLQILAASASIALENARLLLEQDRGRNALQQRAAELAALNRLGRAVSATLTVADTTKASLRGMVDAIGPDLAFLFLRDGDRLVPGALIQPGGGQVFGDMPEHRVGECVCGLAVREHAPVYSLDIASDCRCTWTECKQARLKSLAALPLTSGDEVIGVIGLASATQRDFGQRGPFLETLASQVSAALANARLYDAAQRELAERQKADASRARLTAILENTTDLVSTATPEMRLTYLNKAGRHLAGWGLDEPLTDHVIADLHPCWALAHIVDEGLPAASSTGHWVGETAILHRDGHEIPVSQVILAHRSPQGELEYFSTLMRDISDRRRAEEERERLQSQLAQAQKMESVGRLAGGVAHDFNNMLQAILGNAALALQDVEPASYVRECLEEIQKSAQRSADLTRQLLAFARKQPIVPRVLDLNDKVGGMLRMLRRLIGEDIDLEWRPGADLWPVTLDPTQIDQVLANLCVNARDAVPGAVVIETRNVTLDSAAAKAYPDCTPGDYVRLTVTDSGHGMDGETLSHLFEPFFTTKEVGKGTGLGLATVFGIAKQNGGVVNVRSEPGQGTTFELYFPRSAHAVARSSPPPRGPRRGTEIVLIVEDEEQVLELCRRILDPLGYTVLVASTPHSALAMAQEHASPIDLLLTDVVMPGMNGKELRDRIVAWHRNLKCVFMSGYTADIIAHHDMLGPGAVFLQKPFTIHTLADKVRAALDQRDEP